MNSIEEENNNRIERALSLGLHADSSWDEIEDEMKDRERQTIAVGLGLPANSTWKSIGTHKAKHRQGSTLGGGEDTMYRKWFYVRQ